MAKQSLDVKVLESKEDKTVLEINKQKVTVSSSLLPASSSGAILKLYFFKENEVISEKKLAKTILEEILNGK